MRVPPIAHRVVDPDWLGGVQLPGGDLPRVAAAVAGRAPGEDQSDTAVKTRLRPCSW